MSTPSDRERRMRALVVLVADPVRRYLHRRTDAATLRLWAWDELTSPQIAVVLGISANAASIRLHRAKTRLKAEMSDESHAALKAAGSSGHVRAEEGSTDARR